MKREEFIEKIMQFKAFEKGDVLTDKNITRENAEHIADIIDEAEYENIYNICVKMREGK